jgi:predicted dienelactone hydrolase
MSLRTLLLAPLTAVTLSLAAPALAANAGFMVRPRRPIRRRAGHRRHLVSDRGPDQADGRWASMGTQVVAAGAPIVGEHLPLIVMSHGNGGFFGGHADTAQALAQAGFVVAALTHPGDNYKDQSRATAMADRPRRCRC